MGKSKKKDKRIWLKLIEYGNIHSLAKNMLKEVDTSIEEIGKAHPDSHSTSVRRALRWDKYRFIGTAQRAAMQLGIRNCSEYASKYKQDLRLPSSPDKFYRENWDWWKIFLDTGDHFHTTYMETVEAIKRISPKPTSIEDYKDHRKQDKKLPSRPDLAYLDKWWVNWNIFLWTKSHALQITYEVAQSIAMNLDITSSTQYKRRCKEDWRLPSQPNKSFQPNWVNWATFLKKKIIQRHLTLNAASLATMMDKRITSSYTYEQYYSHNPWLPRFPARTYKQEWQSWEHFLGKNYNPKRVEVEKTGFHATSAHFNRKTKDC